MGCGPASSAPPGVSGSLRPTKSETLEKVRGKVGNLCFSKSSGGSDACYGVRTTC